MNDLVEGWARDARPPASDHARLEVAHAVRVGHRPGDPAPLGAEDPVPGCSCLTCVTLAAGGSREAVDVARVVVDDLRGLAWGLHRKAAETWADAWGASGVLLPPPGVMVAKAREGTARGGPSRAPRDPGRRPAGRDRLPVEQARRVPLADVVARLGLSEPTGRWGEPRIICPFHEDSDPSLRLNVADELWYCDPCGFGGDGIELWRRVRGVSFADAVRELTRRTV